MIRFKVYLGIVKACIQLFDGIKSIYEESKVIYTKKTNTPILYLFRELLEKVPIWNSEIVINRKNINNETHLKIIKILKEDKFIIKNEIINYEITT